MNIAEYLRPGDTVLIGQAAAEPPVLVRKLIEAAHVIDGLTAFCGYTLSDGWQAVSAGKPHVIGYVAHGSLRPLAAAGLAEIVPCHYSRLEEFITSGRIRIDVVLLQVAPPDADGRYNLGATVDYAAVAATRAHTVLVEVNPNMPRTRSSRWLPASRVTAAIASTGALAASPARPPTEAERKVAANVAAFIPSGATIQLGVGALASAVAAELRGRRGLRVRSGLVGDWLVDLDEAGALDDAPDGCVAGMALGTDRLYRYLNDSAKVRMGPLSEQIADAALAVCDPFVAVNSAIEVDLLGQVSAEVAGGRYVGAVGGQLDFFRATRRARSGLAIVALAACNSPGNSAGSSAGGEAGNSAGSEAGTVSRIVPAATMPVTAPQSDIDLVITEYGCADLRGATYQERAGLLVRIAAPQHRGRLQDEMPRWLRPPSQ